MISNFPTLAILYVCIKLLSKNSELPMKVLILTLSKDYGKFVNTSIEWKYGWRLWPKLKTFTNQLLVSLYWVSCIRFVIELLIWSLTMHQLQNRKLKLNKYKIKAQNNKKIKTKNKKMRSITWTKYNPRRVLKRSKSRSPSTTSNKHYKSRQGPENPQSKT